MYQPKQAKAFAFGTNVAIWLILSIFVGLYNSWTTGSSILTRISAENKAALAKIADPQLLIWLLASCVLLYTCLLIAEWKFAAPDAIPHVQTIRRQLQEEAASILLNFGSAYVAIAWFVSEPKFWLGALGAWFVWFFLYSRR